MNPDDFAPSDATAPRCKPVQGVNSRCCVCGVEQLCADFDYDIGGRACVECGELLRGAQACLHDRLGAVPPPDDIGPSGPRPQTNPIPA